MEAGTGSALPFEPILHRFIIGPPLDLRALAAGQPFEPPCSPDSVVRLLTRLCPTGCALESLPAEDPEDLANSQRDWWAEVRSSLPIVVPGAVRRKLPYAPMTSEQLAEALKQ